MASRPPGRGEGQRIAGLGRSIRESSETPPGKTKAHRDGTGSRLRYKRPGWHPDPAKQRRGACHICVAQGKHRSRPVGPTGLLIGAGVFLHTGQGVTRDGMGRPVPLSMPACQPALWYRVLSWWGWNFRARLPVCCRWQPCRVPLRHFYMSTVRPAVPGMQHLSRVRPERGRCANRAGKSPVG